MWPRHMPSRLRSSVANVRDRFCAGATSAVRRPAGKAASQGTSQKTLPNPRTIKDLCQPTPWTRKAMAGARTAVHHARSEAAVLGAEQDADDFHSARHVDGLADAENDAHAHERAEGGGKAR